MKECSIDGCAKNVNCKGLCKMHYTRLTRYGVTHRKTKGRTLDSKHPLVSTYYGMLTRCYNKNHEAYKNYGGRGIRVCERWQDSFQDFIEDMGDRPEGCTLDRIDNNGNYEPANCKWSDKNTQSNNRRRSNPMNGVSYNSRSKRWHSYYWDGKLNSLGTFVNENDAIEARRAYDQHKEL